MSSTPSPNGRRRRLGGIIAAALLLSGGVLVGNASAADATANSCSSPSWHDADTSTGWGTKTGGTPMRSGPSVDCGQVLLLGYGELLDYDCYVQNGVGNTWSHVKIHNSATGGWVYDQNLNNGGSIRLC